MIKICFVSWHFNNTEIFLNYIKHLTPACSGEWKDLKAITDPNEADIVIVFDGHKIKIPEERTIYFCQHPKVTGYNEDVSKSFKTYEGHKCLAHFNSENGLNPGEWWLKHSYDELVALNPPTKSKIVSCIVTYQTHNPMYLQRLLFLERLLDNNIVKELLDLYGRPEERFLKNPLFKKVYKGFLGNNNPDGSFASHTSGKEILIDYIFDLMFDVGPTKNYISERFYDAMLLWTMPIYFGSNNVKDFIPEKSFHQIDILNLNDSDKVIDIMLHPKEMYYENIKYIEEARNLLLNKYQVWPFVHNIIHSL